MTDNNTAFTGTTEIRQQHRFDIARLEDYLNRHLDGFKGPLEVRQFRGGQSNPTYLLTTPAKKYVLRRKPPGKLLPSAHAVDREYRVLSALGEAGMPVAPVHLLCEDDEVIGTSFYVMDFIEGRIFWDQSLPELSREERPAIYDAMNDVIARLHMLDYKALGLEDFGKPGNYFARQISRWSKQYRASETEKIEAADRLMEWLPENIPPGDETSIVHGDFRLDNLIFHPREPRILAILDWELSTLGHPLGDFSYHCLSWHIPSGVFRGIGGLDLAALNIPSESEYIAAYCRRTGREGIDNWEFYLAYNLFRLAAILQGIAGRVRDGTAASAQAEEMARHVTPLAEMGWEMAKRAGA